MTKPLAWLIVVSVAPVLIVKFVPACTTLALEIWPEKQIPANILPAKAGLKILLPNPPNMTFATKEAIKAETKIT